jgi:hypothetical protein
MRGIKGAPQTEGLLERLSGNVYPQCCEKGMLLIGGNPHTNPTPESIEVEATNLGTSQIRVRQLGADMDSPE